MSTAAPNDAWMQHLDRPRILVGVDGSPDGLRAVRYGAGHARANDGVLHLVHAVDDAVLAGAWGVVYDPSTLQEAGAHATREAVETARAMGLAEDQIHDEVVLGNGAAVLARLSEGANLLVVGRRSVSGLERMFIGSTSVAVADAAKCPVVVISAAATPQQVGSRKVIGVGVDARQHSPATLDWAFREAEQRGDSIQVVHVAKPDETSMVTGDLQAAAREGIEQILAPLRQRFPQVAVEVVVGSGQPVDELVGRTSQYDLLVLGVPKPKLLGISLGGVMRAVLAHALCPVVLVK